MENYGHTYAGESFLCTPVKPAENWEIEVYGTKNIQNCYWVEDGGHGHVLHSTKKHIQYQILQIHHMMLNYIGGMIMNNIK